MFSRLELQGQSSMLHKTGTVEINTEFRTSKKPVWWVLLKLACVAAMMAFGAAIALPTLLEFDFPLWQAAAITAVGMLLYTGIAFFCRPEANTDNLGWCGGMMNDPFQASDNVNRYLWKAHCLLGPGRFMAETLLDACALVGLIRSGEVAHESQAASSALASISVGGHDSFDATRPIAPLDPNRFAQTSASFVAGQIQLDTQRLLSGSPSASQGPAVKV
jgi:hypothetical protein